MTLRVNNFEGGTNGAVITPGNSGGASGNAWDTNAAGDVAIYTNEITPFSGSLVGKFDSTTGAKYLVRSFTATTKLRDRYAFYYAATPTADTPLTYDMSGSTFAIQVRLITTNKVRLVSSGTTLWTSTYTLTPGTWYQLRRRVICGTGNAVIALELLSSTGTVLDSFTTSTATTVANLDSTRYGKYNSPASGAVVYMDEVQHEDANTDDTLLGAYPTPAGITAPYASITSSTGYTATGGTVLAALSDNSDATLVTTSDNPTSLAIDGLLPALAAPAGDFTVQVRCDKTGATSGSLVAKLYNGSTLRATSSAVSIPNSTSTVNITFLAANITAVTGWTTGSVRLVIEATAA